ncbi:hypothetical protein GCM10017714_33690 [Curtobacterium pusillum]|uniref:Minor tail protein n=1 Tax=Curtobacterium pusillum TaxID=69373 RepID=A0ABX2M3J4_9MICO|nr:hypothetical protein [Curtobacterium pusillum]NUU12707.1 hypothetical protein [Curtobacterium pusillum]GLK31597.1 hypothetical protein GCM10017610_18820 [Curtobacterium pusillum]
MRTTPLYGIPAFESADRARDIADIDWDRAKLLEAILANQGQPPLGSDLQSLITAVNALTPVTAAASGWANGTNWDASGSTLVKFGNLALLSFDASSSVNIAVDATPTAARVPSGFRPAATVFAPAFVTGISTPATGGIQIAGTTSGGQVTAFNAGGNHRRWSATVIYPCV